jgi:hypothetical protein
MFFALRAMLRDPEAKVLALTALGVIAVGSVAYMLIEHWSPLDAVYFCVVTLATIGYGDLHPTTDLGKAFTVVYILAGLGIIAAFITELARHRPNAPRLAAQITRADAGLGATGSAAASLVLPPGEPGPDSGPGPGSAPLTVIDAHPSDRDPDSPRTDIGPGG